MNTFGLFASSAPAALVVTDIYTVPAGQQANVRVVLTNRGGQTNVRLSVAPLGAADAVAQYMIWDQELAAGESIASLALTLEPGCIIRARSESGDVNFHVVGMLQSTT